MRGYTSDEQLTPIFSCAAAVTTKPRQALKCRKSRLTGGPPPTVVRSNVVLRITHYHTHHTTHYMSKQRVTLTLEEENVEWMDSVCNNRSAYVNDIISEARKGDYDTTDILTAFERKKLDVEEQQLRAKLAAVEEAKGEFESKEQRQTRETWEKAVEHITPPRMRSVDTETWQPDPSDNAVQHYAEQLGITPEEFAEQYPEKREEHA